MNAEKIRVLYVERCEDDCDVMRTLLGVYGVEADVAMSCHECLEKDEETNFAGYVLDSVLPDGDSLELCRSLRARHPERPVIFYSGNSQPRHRHRALQLGANAFLIKPNDMDGLVPTIRRLVTVRPIIPE